MDTNKKTFINIRRPMYCVLLCLFTYATAFSIPETSYDKREYTIKAGFIYRFLFFARWPKNYAEGPNQKIIIGIIGDNPFGDIFNVIEGEKIEGKSIAIRYLKDDANGDEMCQCRILFITPALAPRIEQVLSLVKKHPVLTISETPLFIEKGGMINFVIRENRVEFEINRNAAEQVGIKLSSKLLRLAIHVINSSSPNSSSETRWEDTP